FRQSTGDPSGWGLPSWSVESSKSLMCEHSIATTIFSLTAPGCTILQGEAASQLARSVNEHAASIRDSDASSFGFFAALPPLINKEDNSPNTATVLAEIAYALDVLRADGVTLYTRYGPGNTYLGHEALRPIWAELSARKSVVFIHPTHTVDTNLVNAKLAQPVIDYPHETARTAVDLIMSDRLRQYPDCKIILSHAGGTLPYLASRAAHLLQDYRLSAKSAEEFLDDARTFYFDLALSANEYTLGLLRSFAKEDRVLFGTDFPYAPNKTIAANVGWLDEAEQGPDGAERRRALRGNAEALFPRLAE
ncbi:MAG: hypothetical protein Q9187_002779, partial [Circinaria calcarea]